MNAHLIHGEEAMYSEARQFASSLVPRDGAATVVALTGDLGAGKTTFTRGIARFFGVEESVTSPTFIVEKIYALTGVSYTHLIHIDAYRLQSMEELRVIGWDEITKERGNLIIIEWPELIPEIDSRVTHRLSFEYVDENTRSITYGTPTTS